MRLEPPYAAGGGAAEWGDLGGTLAEQADLQAALDAREPANANIQAHVAAAHAPSNAQKNSDITKAEIEAKLTGQIASHTHAGGSEAFPVGSIFMAVVSTDPATPLGYGTWTAFAAGRVLVGIDAGQTEFDAVRETGGAKTHTLTSAEMPSHTHTQDAHTHTQNSHNHTQDAHTHTQNAHNHIITSQTATTGGATSYEHGTLDTSSAEAEATEVTADATATNQNATATNQAATATNQNATATNQSTGGGGAHNNLQPYIVVYMWERTA